MGFRVLVINGHPDPRPERFCAALARALTKGAKAAGAEVRRLDIGELHFPLVRNLADFAEDPAPPSIRAAQEDLEWADHVCIIFPLWLGGLPALTKGFFEQAFRPDFALRWRDKGFPQGLMAGKSARIIVTMAMPGFAFTWLFGGFGVRAFEIGVLRLAGFEMRGTTVIGGASDMPQQRAKRWLARVQALVSRDL